MILESKQLSRFLADYGMSVVLLLLCILFTVATIKDQMPTGEAAGRAVAKDLTDVRAVMIISGTGDLNQRFVNALAEDLQGHGKTLVARVSGSPLDARTAIRKIVDDKTSVDAIAVSADAATYPFIVQLHDTFPELRQTRVVAPRSVRWPVFLNRDNLVNISSQVVVFALLAVGMTLVIITGGIDLSVGSLIALSAVSCAYYLRGHGGADATLATMFVAGAVGVGVCALIGAASGVFITLVRVPAFIATLGMMQIAAGAAEKIANNESIYDVPTAFQTLGRGAAWGMPYSVLLMLCTYVVFHIVMSRTTFGRYVYATGGNMEAARLSGVRVNSVRLIVYTLSGAMAGLAGVVMTSQLSAGAPTYGLGYELYAIAAVVVGGTSLLGGSGKIFSTLIGAFIIAVIRNGLNLTGIESSWQKVILGAVILMAVTIDMLRRHGRNVFRRT